MHTTKAEAASFFEAASALASQYQLKILPVDPGTNKCTLPGWPSEATAELEKIQRWWTEKPEANVGVLCDGIIVVDLDGSEGEAGYQKLRLAAGLPDELPEDFRDSPAYFQKTPGGHSLVFLVPEGFKTQRKIRAFPGVDLLGAGGYFVVAPSVRNDEKYTDGHYVASPEFAWINAPSKLLELASTHDNPPRHERKTSTATSSSKSPEKIPEGQRHKALTTWAGKLVRSGFRERDELFAVLDALNRSRCSPPSPENELQDIVRDASTKWEGSLDVSRCVFRATRSPVPGQSDHGFL